MAKKPAAPASVSFTEPDAIEIEYIGPPGQTSPELGPLSAGRRYQVTATFGAYLLATHPDYWNRPDAA